ncbi:MAG: MerR family transcriptional regulator [Lentisphaeria bacterium]|nr:MerR family transcriptional regulator [Lentisphaeria bacterium]
MTDKKLFLVSDLANELGVPRTTLNDWLKRYDRYLATEMSGRRRAYTPAALNVLREVNKMRNSGMAASRIELELEKSFAIRPDEVADDAVQEQEKSVTLPEEASSDVKPEEKETPSLPVLRREEFDRFIGTLEEVSRLEKRRRRSALYVWTVIVLLALFSVLTAWYMARLVKLQAAHNARLASIASENAEARKVQESGRLAAEKALAEQKKQIAALKSDVAAARKAGQDEKMQSRKAIAEVGKLVETVKTEQSNLRRELKNKYGRELSEKERKIEELRKAEAERTRQLEVSKKDAAGLRRELEQLKSHLKKLETEKAAAEAAAKAAAEKPVSK